MAKNLYNTANGKVLNMDRMRLLNEKTIAVGNMSVNARGDRVAPNGEIIKTRNEIMKERRNLHPVVRYNGHRSNEVAPVGQETGTETTPSSTVQETTTVQETATVQIPTTSSSLRGSLASAVNIDLTNVVLPTKKTINRI
jgi:hypothetical protein